MSLFGKLANLKTLASVAGGALMLAASAGGALADKTKFDFWFGNTGDIAKRVQDVCQHFNDLQADYEVDLHQPGRLFQRAAEHHRGLPRQQAADHHAGLRRRHARPMLSEAYYPVNKLMADNGYKIDWDNYFPGISSYYATSKGDLYSMPFNSSTAVLYWNQDAFKKIGKDAAPKTWEEAADDMEALKAAGYDCPLAIDITQTKLAAHGAVLCHPQPADRHPEQRL